MRMKGLTLAGTGILLAAWVFAGKETDQVRDDVIKLAGIIGAKDTQGAKQQAAGIGKRIQLEDAMDLMRLRAKSGLGVGDKPGAIRPDGIEAQIVNLHKKALSPKDLQARSKDLARAAYVTAAIAAIAHDMCPVPSKQGAKDPAQWRTWCDDMYKFALELAAAAEAQKPDEVKNAAARLDANCNACHAVYR
jgi:hypothetical protein